MANFKTIALIGAGLVGVYLVATRMGAPAADGEGDQGGTTSLLYGGGGGFTVGQNTSGGSIDTLNAMAAALNNSAILDNQLGTLKVNAERDVALAGIGADLQLGLSSNALTAQAQSKAMLEAMAKTGASGFSANVGGVNINSQVLYTDTRKNLALAAGYNPKGDLVSAGGNILMQSGQSKYDMASYVNSSGVKALAPIAPLSAFDLGSNPKNSTVTPHGVTRTKQNLGTAGTDYKARKEN